MTVLVEGFTPDALSLARLLAGEGVAVRLAGPGRAPREAAALDGVSVEERRSLDRDPGVAEIAYLDVWTPEVAPRVRRLRAQGTRLSCLADLLLERAGGPVLGVTGTAGKSTTSAFAAQLARAAGRAVRAATRARAGNLWATGELLDPLPGAGELLVLELTSSHLCFTAHSPATAVVTSFWPDHLELHGSLQAYRAAKETIVRHQSARDAVVVDPGDEATAGFARGPARPVGFGVDREVDDGAFLAGDVVVARWSGAERVLAAGAVPVRGRQRANVAAAVAAVLAAGVPLDGLPPDLGLLAAPPFRAATVRGTGRLEVVDDGLAATPAKARATLGARAAGSVVLLAGGALRPRGVRVHASPAERVLLEGACDEAARVARVAVLFGAAGRELGSLLAARGVPVERAPGLAAAVERAVALAAPEGTVVFSPFYPVAQRDREAFAALARSAARRSEKVAG
jgi:UDP-N-acetylmuramoylalanine--D-glutamate ligase